MSPEKKYFGKLTPRYTFVHDLFPLDKGAVCSECGGKLRHRQHHFAVYIEPDQLQTIRISMPTCTRCEIIIINRPRFDSTLEKNLVEEGDEIYIGNNLAIIGTVNPAHNKIPDDIELPLEDFLGYLHDVKKHIFSDLNLDDISTDFE